jgi:ribosomal protein S12 methylthiotransferase
MILEFAQAKEEGNLEKLYVMGCLSERYLKELAVEIPQVDKFYGKFNWRELLQDLGKAYHDELHIERTLTTPKHYAYLKISEGCDRLIALFPSLRDGMCRARWRRYLTR